MRKLLSAFFFQDTVSTMCFQVEEKVKSDGDPWRSGIEWLKLFKVKYSFETILKSYLLLYIMT